MKCFSALALLAVTADALSGLGPAKTPRSILLDTNANITKVADMSYAKPTADCDPTWTSCGPDSTDYNEETFVEGLPISVERLFAAIYCLLISSAPLALAGLLKREEPLTKAHMLESLALVAWLWSFLFLLTNILKFQSSHWVGTRPLTPVEAVYLMSQILTTVGYGDITPAYPRGQVWIGINVIIGLCLYGSIVMEVVDMAYERIKNAMSSAQVLDISGSGKIKDWLQHCTADYTSMTKSSIFFGVTAGTGVLFWHLYPGEGKTWLQAVYMSIITLSTVGFGAFNALTEGGKVFGAYWMLIGVAALGALIGSFIELSMKLKQVQRHRQSQDHEDFKKIMEECLDKNGKLDKARFLKVGLMLTKGAKIEDLEKIELRFQHLVSESKEPGAQALRRSQVVDAEGPVL